MAAATSHRAWEMRSSSPGPTSTPRGQLPSISALTNNLPAAPSSNGLSSPASTRERDSGAWSSQPQSTRSSAYSAATSNYMSSNTNSYMMSPNRISSVSNNSSHLGSASHPSADYSIPAVPHIGSPGFSNNNSSQLPSLNQAHEPNRQSQVSQQSQQSQDFPPQESRRSSIGSQVNQGLNSLQINGATSPYSGSVNHSTTSLAQNLNRERGIQHQHGPLSLRNSRSSAQLPLSPMSPSANNENRVAPFVPRIAPPIGRNPRSDVYNADEPVPGQAYAFPDAPDLEPGALPPKSSSRHNIHDDSRSGSFLRRDSGQNSIASSIVTSDSRMPPGQHRLEEPNMPGTHHHTLQQNQMSNLDEDDLMTPEDGSQPYSRTPALRVSHKMAERKRRSEMKDLFENLRSQIPSNQGSKSSKWEILTKASEYIKQLEGASSNGQMAEKQLRLACHDIDHTRRDNDSLRNENQRLMQELQMLRQQPPAAVAPPGSQQPGPPPPPSQAPPPPPPQQQAPSSQPPALYPSHYNPPPPPPPPASHDPSRSLPPLTNGISTSSSMQGVQYSHEHR